MHKLHWPLSRSCYYFFTYPWRTSRSTSLRFQPANLLVYSPYSSLYLTQFSWRAPRSCVTQNLRGGERWQSLQEHVHAWNVKYWHCTITRPVWNPTLMLFLVLPMHQGVIVLRGRKGGWVCRWGFNPNHVTVCYWWISTKLENTRVNWHPWEMLVFYTQVVFFWFVLSRHCWVASYFLSVRLSVYLCWCFTVRKWLNMHFQSVVGAVVASAQTSPKDQFIFSSAVKQTHQ